MEENSPATAHNLKQFDAASICLKIKKNLQMSGCARKSNSIGSFDSTLHTRPLLS